MCLLELTRIFELLQDRPTLTIAHHLLHGTLVKLPKPLAVLRKAAIPPIDPEEEEEAAEVEEEQGNRKEGESRRVQDRQLTPVPESSPMHQPPKPVRQYNSLYRK